jgi:hypothetical protein
MKKERVAIITVATGNYVQYLWQFWYSVAVNWAEQPAIYCLTDYGGDALVPPGVMVLRHEHSPWPCPTLMRYHAFVKNRDAMTGHGFYLYNDVDMRYVSPVDPSVFTGGTLAVRHPGFHAKKRDEYPHEGRKASACYVPPEKRMAYYCGGCQGGERYMELAVSCAALIDQDLNAGIMPSWHDESAYNKHLSDNPPDVVLGPGYCYPGNDQDAFSWGLGDVKPVLVAIDKDHARARGGDALV